MPRGGGSCCSGRETPRRPLLTTRAPKSRYAKSLAFAWLMTDNVAFAERALVVMQGVAFPPRGGDLGEPHNEGEVVAQYAVAYDILHSYAAANDPQALQEMRSILGEEADRLWKGIVIGKVGFGLFPGQNSLARDPASRQLAHPRVRRPWVGGHGLERVHQRRGHAAGMG